jgi:riboflavin-specific deaminase-like protein
MRNAECGTDNASGEPGRGVVRSVAGRADVELPFLFLNLAMTADGKIASANRTITSFGSRRDLEGLFALRATADAVMSGARTVDEKAVDLGPGPARFRRRRLRHGLAEFNLRVIVSGSGSVHPAAGIFQRRFSPILVLTSARISERRLRKLRGLADDVFVCGEREIDFPEALRWLRQHWNVKCLLCEGGGQLNDALFRAHLVQRIHLTVCPLLFGGRTAPTIADGTSFPKLAQTTECRLRSLRRVGDELFLVYDVLSSAP